MFSMNALQAKMMVLRNEIREAGQEISATIVNGQEETDRAGALLDDRLQQIAMDETEEIARHADAMAEIRQRRDTAMKDYGMALKAVEGRIRVLGNALLERREPA